MPAEEWEAVKQYRNLYLQRQGVAAVLDGINRGLSDPALAFVKGRKPVSV